MARNMIRDIILKHFPNFAMGETGKYHNVSLADLEKMAEDILFQTEPRATLEETSPPIDFMRLDIAGRAMQGILANTNASGMKGQKATAELALSMADALIDAHLGTLDKFNAKVGDMTNASTP